MLPLSSGRRMFELDTSLAEDLAHQRAGVARVAAPLLVRHHERERHVLVGVGRGALADGAAVRVDVPVHQALAVEVRLRVRPQAVERRLVAHVHGEHHPVGDPLGDRVVAVFGALHAQAAARAAGGDHLRLVGVPRRHHVGVVAVHRVAAGRRQAVLREREVRAARRRRRVCGPQVVGGAPCSARPTRSGRAGRSGRVSASAASRRVVGWRGAPGGAPAHGDEQGRRRKKIGTSSHAGLRRVKSPLLSLTPPGAVNDRPTRRHRACHIVS